MLLDVLAELYQVKPGQAPSSNAALQTAHDMAAMLTQASGLQAIPSLLIFGAPGSGLFSSLHP